MNLKEVEKFIKNNEFDVQSAMASFLAVDLVYSGYAKSQKVHKVKYVPILVYLSFKNLSSFYQILPKKSLDKLSKKIYIDFLKNPKSLTKLINDHHKKAKEIDALWEKYDEEADNLNEEKMLFYFEKTAKEFINWWMWGIIGEDKCEAVNTEVVPRFQKRHSLTYDKAKEIIDVLAHPDELTFFNQERLLFLEVCQNISAKKNKLLEKNIIEYLNKFFWIKTDFYNTKKVTRATIIADAQREIKQKGLSQINSESQSIKKNNKLRLRKFSAGLIGENLLMPVIFVGHF